ncbi:MAG TPA: prenyltransferase [Candidatus Binatia bacterium]|nr:prenyltransferase [Candidatus Binatia bacterium]
MTVRRESPVPPAREAAADVAAGAEVRRLARALAAFVRLGRPRFLVGGFVLHGLGAAVAVASGAPFVARRFTLGQVAVTAFQLMTHYANDYFDYAADRANLTPTRWSGGSRVLARGELPRAVALRASLVLAACGLAATAALACDGSDGRLAAIVLAVAAALSWAYSAPPLRLHSRGLGEIDAALVVAVLVPAVGLVAQPGGAAAAGLLAPAVAPLVLLELAMLVAFELPDARGDAAVGKRTLVVRLGAPAGAALYAVAVVSAYGALPLLVAAGLPRSVALAAAFPAPIAAWRVARIAAGDHRDPRRWPAVCFWAAALFVATAVAEVAAFGALAAVSLP